MNKSKFTLFIFLGFILIYGLMPLIAGIFEIGDRWGPKIYAIAYHEPLYKIGWKLSHFDGEKPRVGFWYKPENRPWLYGLKSKNKDPLQLKKTIKEFKESLE